MGKNAILVVSILELIAAAIFGALPGELPIPTVSMPKTIAFLIMIVLWLAVVYVVFVDVKKRNKSPIFAGMCFVFGGIGGIVYYAITYKESDQMPAQTPVQQGIRPSARNNLKIFSIIMLFIFGLAFLGTLPWSKNAEMNVTLTVSIGAISLFWLIMAILMRKKVTKTPS